MKKNSVNLPNITFNSRLSKRLNSVTKSNQAKSPNVTVSRNADYQFPRKSCKEEYYYSGILNSTRESILTFSTNKEKTRFSQGYSFLNTVSKDSSLYNIGSNLQEKNIQNIFTSPNTFLSYKPIRKKILFNKDITMKLELSSQMNKHYVQRKIIFQNLKNFSSSNLFREVKFNQSNKVVNVNFSLNLPNNSKDFKGKNIRYEKSFNKNKFKAN